MPIPRVSVAEVGQFLGTLETRSYQPREYVVRHTTVNMTRDTWQRVMLEI